MHVAEEQEKEKMKEGRHQSENLPLFFSHMKEFMTCADNPARENAGLLFSLMQESNCMHA